MSMVWPASDFVLLQVAINARPTEPRHILSKQLTQAFRALVSMCCKIVSVCRCEMHFRNSAKPSGVTWRMCSPLPEKEVNKAGRRRR